MSPESTPVPPRTLVLIHGNFVTRRSWDPWVERYQARGFTVVPIAYPLRNEPVDALRRKHPDPALARLALPEVIEHIVRTIRALPEPPIVIGHSFGGLLTQILVNRDLTAAGVAIDSVPPPGVPGLEWSFLRSTWPVINPVMGSRPYLMPLDHFRYTFTNDLSDEEQRAAWERDVVPESRRLARGGLGRAARVDFRKERSPLLLIAGEKDHIMPASLNRRNWARYRRSPSMTDFKAFPGRTHYSVIAGPGWEEVADYALDWALDATGAPASGPRFRATA